MIYVLATSELQEGCREKFLEILKANVPLVRAEEGCLQYDYHLSCEGEDRVVLLERWADEEALRRHGAQPHMQKLSALKPRYVLDTRVERFS